MVLTGEQMRVRDLLTETVTLLCKNGLHFSRELGIEALIGITLDKEEVFLVSIKETLTCDRNAATESASNAVAISDVTEETDIPRSSQFSQTFSIEESGKQSGRSFRSDRICYRNSGVDSVSASKTILMDRPESVDDSSPVVTKSEIFIDAVDDIICSDYSTPRKRRRTDGGHRASVSARSGVEQNKGSSVPQDSMRPCTSSENATFSDHKKESPINAETGLIEIKREQHTDDESSYLGVGSLYSCAFENLGSWGWEPDQEKSKDISKDTSSEGHPIQYTSTPIWNQRTHSKVELLPGSEVFVSEEDFHWIQQEEKGSRLVRRLVHSIFPDHRELASSSCLGLGKQSPKNGLDQQKVDAIKEYVRRNMPHVPDKKVIRVINNLCCEARRKLLRHGRRQSHCTVSMTEPLTQ